MIRNVFQSLFVLILSACVPAIAIGATCGNTAAGFGQWLNEFKREAPGYGIRPATLNKALSGVTYHRKVIQLDRNQKSFRLSFDEFYARRVNNAMIRKAKRLGQQHARLFSQIERKYGVPAPVILAIWGLETNFGGYIGNMSVMRSLATLAYDCRRTQFFTNELVSALIIVQRGDMQPSEMRGAWAGEIGQTQFLASSYVQYAVDFDRNGRRDLIRSVPDVLASTANYLRQKGWRPGQPWGPGTANYEVIRRWNKASVYVQTISVMADKIAY
ncbi:lytic transglycosylase domain-containing protein [Roseibium sp. RKSG952]|uniref:lytic murein transglycosylase n=1 Tax=Roseibium sp. RKSG952 TaxID=2529384 RepID=UPI0012BD293D|nr:lytic murein transglycosylase [Roseibium sp. RKSG952]MTH98243.1 lytic murein transglycosylase [Roseibium sp. RKSG952]